MMINKKNIILLFIIININFYVFAQDILPIYSDYLTDNIFLIHPSAAGISEYGKLRVTTRKQWMDYKEAPALQTITAHTHLGNNVAVGIAMFNDKNGHFAQQGGNISFAYHLNLDYHKEDQLSFGLSLVFINNSLNGDDYNIIDSDVSNSLVKYSTLNFDASFAYRIKGLYAFYTAKNLSKIKNKLIANNSNLINRRKHILSAGYKFNYDEDEIIKFEPSIMYQYVEQLDESIIDFNLKVFIPFASSEIWGGISYRKNLESYNNQSANYISPFLGIKYKKIIFSYSYTNQLNNKVFSDGVFHQITLGYNFFMGNRYTRKSLWDL